MLPSAAMALLPGLSGGACAPIIAQSMKVTEASTSVLASYAQRGSGPLPRERGRQGLLRRGLEGVDVGVGKAEMVADLVDQDVGYQFLEGDVAALGPLV